jgi:hypothetical protein
MHEMNISDSPWWAGHSYNQTGSGIGDTAKFKLAWRRVWQIFQTVGTPNVQWVWSPNYASNPGDAWNNLHNYYPGDQYVDWIGLSGYNWAASRGAVATFDQIYTAVLTELQCRYAKPIIVAEIGSAPYSTGTPPGDKASWVADAYTRLQGFPLVRAVSWFNDFAYHNVNDADFRVWTNSNVGYGSPPGPVPADVTAAYRSAVSDSSFAGSFSSASLLDPPTTRCPGDNVSGNGVLSALPASAVVARSGQTSTSVDVAALGLAGSTNLAVAGCPPGATCSFADGHLTAPWDGTALMIAATGNTPPGTYVLTISGGGGTVQVTVAVMERIFPMRLPLLGR